MELFTILIGVLAIIGYVALSKAFAYIKKTRRKKIQGTVTTISVAVDPVFKDEIQEACRELHEKFGIKETMKEFTLRALYREMLEFETSQESIEQAKQYLQKRELDKYHRYDRITTEKQRRERLKQNYEQRAQEYYAGGHQADSNRGTGVTTPKTENDRVSTGLHDSGVHH